MHTRSSRSGVRRILWILAAVAMIVAVMPLAGASADTATDPRVIDLIADGRADAPDVPFVVGTASIWNDAGTLYVDLKIADGLDGDWCFTSTNIAVDATYIELPQTKKGLAIPGKFDFKDTLAECEKVASYEFDMVLATGTGYAIAVHANVMDMNALPVDFDVVDAYLNLPDTAIMKVVRPSPTYVNLIISGSTSLDGTYNGWCADEHHSISLGGVYDVDISSSYSSAPINYGNITPYGVDHLDEINWVINNPGSYSMTTIQNVIWALLGDRSAPTSGDAKLLYDEALLHDGFIPECGDSFLVILSTNALVKQTMVFQTTFAELGIECEYRGETAWGGDWDTVNPDAFEFEFIGKGWAGYIWYTAGPIVVAP